MSSLEPGLVSSTARAYSGVWSRPGTSEAHAGYVWVECEDLGGPWHCRRPDDRPHGLDLIEALAGPDNWGTETTSDDDRIVWARLNLPRQEGPHA